MTISVLALIVAAYVGADQQEPEVVSPKIPSEEKSEMTEKASNHDVEDPERSMVEFLKELSKRQMRREHILSPDQQRVLEESLQSFKRKSVDHVEPRVLSVEEVNLESGSAKTLFQGDMVLSKKQQEVVLSEIHEGRSKRQAYIDEYESGKWTDLVVRYELNDTLSKRGRAAFRKAAKLWTRNTCINITEIEDDDDDEEVDKEGEDEEEGDAGEEQDPLYDYYYYDSEENGDSDELELPRDYFVLKYDYITVNGGNHCGSSVGRQRQTFGWQTITLGRKCETIGTAAHELAHALGFWHTHARHDRDEYVTVNWNDLDVDNYTRTQFEKQSNKSNNNYGIPYDYGSVMHYGTTAGSTNRTKPIFVPVDGLYTETLGSLLLSFYDILMMNTHYNCTGFCETVHHEKCKNHGFAHPRNCSKCICPSGYGGDFCDERPPICGHELNATSNWTKLITANSSEMTQGGEDGYKRCVYWVKAPNGSNIEVKLTKLPENVSADGCIYAGVEIKAHQDQGLTGYRFCSKDEVNKTFTSNSSTVPVISYMRRRRNDSVTELEYRIA